MKGQRALFFHFFYYLRNYWALLDTKVEPPPVWTCLFLSKDFMRYALWASPHFLSHHQNNMEILDFYCITSSTDDLHMQKKTISEANSYF